MFSKVKLVFGLSLALTTISIAAPFKSPQPQVVGYVFAQDKTLKGENINPTYLTRINYAFANIASGRMVTGGGADASNFAYLNGLKKKKPTLRVLISVGGWLWSTNFSDVSLTEESRIKFIDSVMEFLIKYDLDGLDIDWEYPGMPGAGHPFRSEDKSNFTSLVRELRARFDAQTKKTHHRLYLTIAAGGSDEFIEHTEMEKVQLYLDTVNLMAYDYYEPGSDAITGHHAPLFTNPMDPKKISADRSVEAFERAGVPANKLVLGVPFYGHEWGQVSDRNHGLYQPGKEIPNAYAPYSAISQSMIDHGFTRYWDTAASVPYLYNPDRQVFVSYEDPDSLRAKGKYVLEHKLGGVMFWDYNGDPSGSLLEAVGESLHPGAEKTRSKR